MSSKDKEYIWKVNINGDFNHAIYIRAKTKEEALEKGWINNPKYNCALIMEEVDEEEQQTK